METIANYDGSKIFKVPTSVNALRWILNHPDSDGCKFTHEMLTKCGAPPPAECQSDCAFEIRGGELYAISPDGDALYTFDDDGTGSPGWQKIAKLV